MKPVYFLVILLLAVIVAMSSCTNDEGDADLDVLTPNDSTETSIAR